VGHCPACGVVEDVPEVAVVDSGTELGEVREVDATPYEEKARAWHGLADVCASRGYKWKWAAMQYQRRFGHWPSKRMTAWLQARLAAA